jgi:predicted O-methyltransferase YrrM
MSSKTTLLTEKLADYLVDVSVRPNSILEAHNQATQELIGISMQSSPEELNFLGWLVGLLNAKNILELGTFTGMSALAMAQQLPEDGSIICCDKSEEFTKVAYPFWQQAGVQHKIELRLDDALKTVKNLMADPAYYNHFDLIFIDADKSNYANYYELCLSLVRVGGVIAIDNVLWHGAVLDVQDNSLATQSIRNLNRKIYEDQRVAITLLPIGDGLTLARKL